MQALGKVKNAYILRMNYCNSFKPGELRPWGAAISLSRQLLASMDQLADSV